MVREEFSKFLGALVPDEAIVEDNSGVVLEGVELRLLRHFFKLNNEIIKASTSNR